MSNPAEAVGLQLPHGLLLKCPALEGLDPVGVQMALRRGIGQGVASEEEAILQLNVTECYLDPKSMQNYCLSAFFWRFWGYRFTCLEAQRRRVVGRRCE